MSIVRPNLPFTTKPPFFLNLHLIVYTLWVSSSFLSGEFTIFITVLESSSVPWYYISTWKPPTTVEILFLVFIFLDSSVPSPRFLEKDWSWKLENIEINVGRILIMRTYEKENRFFCTIQNFRKRPFIFQKTTNYMECFSWTLNDFTSGTVSPVVRRKIYFVKNFF